MNASSKFQTLMKSKNLTQILFERATRGYVSRGHSSLQGKRSCPRNTIKHDSSNIPLNKTLIEQQPVLCKSRTSVQLFYNQTINPCSCKGQAYINFKGYVESLNAIYKTAYEKKGSKLYGERDIKKQEIRAKSGKEIRTQNVRQDNKENTIKPTIKHKSMQIFEKKRFDFKRIQPTVGEIKTVDSLKLDAIKLKDHPIMKTTHNEHWKQRHDKLLAEHNKLLTEYKGLMKNYKLTRRIIEKQNRQIAELEKQVEANIGSTITVPVISVDVKKKLKQ